MRSAGACSQPPRADTEDQLLHLHLQRYRDTNLIFNDEGELIYPILPANLADYLLDPHLYRHHPAWEICTPEEYYKGINPVQTILIATNTKLANPNVTPSKRERDWDPPQPGTIQRVPALRVPLHPNPFSPLTSDWDLEEEEDEVGVPVSL